jgi:EpsI family protein
MMAASFFNVHARTLLVTGLMCVAAVAARIVQPTLHESDHTPQLESSVPAKVGTWSALASPVTLVSLNKSNEPDINQPYDESLLRTYVDGQGHQIAVAVAWGKRQRQEVKIHRPELCYPAQGFAVKQLSDHNFTLKSETSQQAIEGKRMLASDRNGGLEVVSYWIRIGSIYSDSALETRMHILREGLAGRVTDGLLMRVSQRVSGGTSGAELEEVFQRQEKFVEQLVNSVTPATRDFLAR